MRNDAALEALQSLPADLGAPSWRLWTKVDRGKPDECWPFTGGRFEAGYGRISLGNGKYVGAHRLAYEFVNGPIPEGLGVLHSCDNPPCCNPRHLRAGTQTENMLEMHAKGRCDNRGSRNGRAKLTEIQVAEIRSRLDEGERHAAIALRFGVSRQAIGLIGLGLTWTEEAA